MTKYLCLLLEAPYYYPLLGHKIELINQLALKADEIVCFFYLDGIHQLNTDQYPKNFSNILEIFNNLANNYSHIQFLACSRCTGARGYIDLDNSNFEENQFSSSKLGNYVKIVSIREFGKYVNQGYKIVQI